MNGLLDSGYSPDFLKAIGIDPEKMKEQQQNQGLLSAGLALLAGSGPSTQRTSLGQLVAQAGSAGMQAMRGAGEDQISNAIRSLQVKDMMAKREQQQKLQQSLQGAFKPSMTMADYEKAQSNIDPMALEGMSASGVMQQATPTGPMTVDRNKILQSLAQYGGTEGINAFLTATKTPELPGIVGEFSAAKAAGIIPANATLEQFAAMKKPPGVTVNTGEKATPFEKKSQEAQATMFSDIQKAGNEANRTLRDVTRLGNILERVDTGGVAAFKQIAGNFGIKTEGLDDIQAAQAIINKLVPQQRPQGSGPMSDADLELYKQSLPRLINQPGANKEIIRSMREINEYMVKEGEIASAVLDGNITAAEGRKRLAALGNPIQDFFDRNPTASPGSPVKQISKDDLSLINKYRNK